MTIKISPHDWEKLSTYLDGELSRQDQKRLETRLQSEVTLQNALNKLRRTKTILRRAPRMSAPRNFTITPKMVGQKEKKPRPRLFPVFRMATALATILLVAVLALDFGGGIVRSQWAAAPRDEVIAESVEAEKAAADEAEEATGEGVEEPQAAEAVSEAEVVEEEAVEEEMLAAEADTQPEAANTKREEQEAEEKSAAPGGETYKEEMTPLPTTTREQPTPSRTAPPQAQVSRPTPRLSLSPLRVIEIILMAAMIGFGMATLWVKRK